MIFDGLDSRIWGPSSTPSTRIEWRGEGATLNQSVPYLWAVVSSIGIDNLSVCCHLACIITSPGLIPSFRSQPNTSSRRTLLVVLALLLALHLIRAQDASVMDKDGDGVYVRAFACSCYCARVCVFVCAG